MNEQVVADIFKEALLTILTVSGPVLLIVLVVGVLVSIMQSITQMHEATLAFIPKILAVFLSLIIFLPWMIQIVERYTVNLVSNINAFIAH